MTEIGSSEQVASLKRGLSNRSLFIGICLQGMVLSASIALVDVRMQGATWHAAIRHGVINAIGCMIITIAIVVHGRTRVTPQHYGMSRADAKEFFRPSPTLWIFLLSLPVALLVEYVLWTWTS